MQKKSQRVRGGADGAGDARFDANWKALMATSDELYDEANALKDQGDLEGAVAKLEEILQSDPNHVLTHAALGVHLHKLGRLDEAIEHAVKVTELEPADSFSFTQLSVIYQRCGRIPEAEEAMARARMIQMGAH
jgi:Flp pilus assembly protein TadD